MIKEKTQKTLRLLGILFAICALLGFFSYGYLTKCVLGANSISRYSLYCYLCVSSNIRNFPVNKSKNESTFNVSQISDQNHPVYNEVQFVTEAASQEVDKESKEYLKLIGFDYTSNYETSVYENYIWFESEKSYVGYKITADDNSRLTKVTVVEQFKDESLK